MKKKIYASKSDQMARELLAYSLLKNWESKFSQVNDKIDTRSGQIYREDACKKKSSPGK